EREIAPDSINARHHHPDDRCGAAGARCARKSPRRARQIDVEPAITESRSARRDALLEPRVPHADERVSDTPAQEVAMAWQLPVETDSHRTGHSATTLHS